MSSDPLIEVANADALQFAADVLALKHAQATYGVDEAAVRLLLAAEQELSLPAQGSCWLVDSPPGIEARELLFVGVPRLRRFGYEEIRRFGRRVLTYLASARPGVRHVALTIHGPGYGLDEVEAFESQVAGLVEAVKSRTAPPALERITVVERNQARATRLRTVLAELLPHGRIEGPSASTVESKEEEARTERLAAAGYKSETKANIFVAMPFKKEMNDTFHYGIQGAVRAAGFVCERADLASFTGDVLEWVKKRIKSATLLVADLTDANPNVYLEVGYAWGCGVPTVLIVSREGDQKVEDQVQFNVQGQRCLPYESIKNLEELLTEELSRLR